MRSDWMSKAACKDMSVEAFYSPRGVAGYTRAVAVCARCPVRQRCLDFALANNEEHGVWGGTTKSERFELGMKPAWSGDWVARERRKDAA